MENSTSKPVISPSAASADTSIITANNTGNGAWITIYKGVFDSKSDWGCMDARPGTRTWTAGNYEVGDTVKVQAEVKDTTDCSGSTTYTTDTTQVLGYNSTFTLQAGTNNDYYWDFSG